jgi:hypothetical protein
MPRGGMLYAMTSAKYDAAMDVVKGGLGRSAAVASVVVLVVFVIHNAYWLAVNQRELPPHERPHRSSRDIEQLARESPDPRVRGRLALLYHLSKHIPGAAITISPSLEAERWSLERVARLKVTTGLERLVVAPGSVRRLRALNTSSGLWSGSGRRGIHLNVCLEPGVTDYVIAERRDGRELFLLPAMHYAKVAARP